MRWLVGLAAVGLALFVTISWIGQNVADSGFRQDVAMAPPLVSGVHGSSALVLAEEVKRLAKERGIELDPANLQVEVSEGKSGVYRVAAGIMRASSSAGGPTAIQDITVHASYDRKFFGIKRHIDTTVNTSCPGNGPASSYPAPVLPILVPVNP
jgi:hypothetical protein